MPGIAKKIVISEKAPFITVDGKELPFVIGSDWTVTFDGVPRLNCSIMADQIEVVGQQP